MPFDLPRLRARLADLAARGVYVGTSSWKYPGWCGMVYDEARYRWRGRFVTTRFEKGCLAEYAETFKTVSVDATYYAPPTVAFLEGLAAQVPADFRFGFKASSAFTVKRTPNHPRFGQRAGQANASFLDAQAFARDFLGPLSSVREKVGIVMLEFSRFGPAEYARGRDFVADLEPFLAALPTGWPLGIELRNRGWLVPEYFACLARHGVAHVFNAWTQMPTVTEQMAVPGARPNPGLVAARFLLGRGREYGDAVARFEPFDAIHEVNDEGRQAAIALIGEGTRTPERKSYLYVNNRLEGCAPLTIDAVVGVATHTC
jgi:uncharacterized protein YecE (DUF72 family)